MSSRAVQRFSVLAVCMKHLCAVTKNPFISNVESFNCRAGPCRGLCERTWRHTKLWQLGGSLLFISLPALRCPMAVRGSSPPLPLWRSQIMIRKDANGKEYNDYQAQHWSVYRSGWRGLIGCDTEMHFIFLAALKKFSSTGLHTPAGSTSATFGAPFRCFCSTAERKGAERQEVMSLPPACAGLCHDWLEEHLTTMKTRKKTFVVLLPLTSVYIYTTKRRDQMHQLTAAHPRRAAEVWRSKR